MGVNMRITVKDTEVNYIQYGKGKDIILLHGWGQNIEMMKPLGDKLEDKYRITIIDFPGFGDSPEPKEVFKVEDYCRRTCQSFKDKKTNFGWSFFWWTRQYNVCFA